MLHIGDNDDETKQVFRQFAFNLQTFETSSSFTYCTLYVVVYNAINDVVIIFFEISSRFVSVRC